MKSSIALVGFMGSGKTSVGRALAARLGREFIELDALIEQRAGKTIPEIFRQDGEIAFRELEIEVTRETAGTKRAVIACGGGLVLNKINTDRLGQESLIVYLTASPGAVLERTSADKNGRPLLPGRLAEIRGLLAFRKPFYERAADITVDTSNLDVDSVVEQIIEKLKRDESFNL